MNKIFHSRFWSAMEFLGSAFVLNCMWLIGCLPIVTAGASTAALCQCYFRIFRNREEPLPRLFLNGFKNCFKQASLVWLVHLFFLVDVGVSYGVFTRGDGEAALLDGDGWLVVGAVVGVAIGAEGDGEVARGGGDRPAVVGGGGEGVVGVREGGGRGGVAADGGGGVACVGLYFLV